MVSTQKSGYAFVVLAAVLWAASGSSAKFLFNGGMTAMQLIQLRTGLSFISLLAWLAVWNRSLLKIAVKDLFYFFLLGTIGLAAAQFFYLFAISKINVAVAILLHYTGPVFVALYSALFLGEKLTGKSITAILGALAGCYLMVGAYDLNILSLNRVGIMGGIAAALAFAAYSLLSEYGMRKYSPWTVLLYGMLFAALLWNVVQPPFNSLARSYSAVEWWWILFIGIGGTTIPFGLYFEGVSRIRATHASVTATLEPITAGVMSAVFLGEMLGPWQILGGVLVIASILVLQWKSRNNN